MKPLLLSSGEPAGIGPDICLTLADYEYPVVIAGDMNVLAERARQLNLSLELNEFHQGSPFQFRKGCLQVLHSPCVEKVTPGQLNPRNATMVINMLAQAIDACLAGHFSALVTAPVHKAVINQAGIPFTGHTEFLAERCNTNTVVMMLTCHALRVALVTTHLPLRAVPDAINEQAIKSVIRQLHQSLQIDFGIGEPTILVAGLNPHAGEGGYLGREEIEVISPALQHLQAEGINVQGPFPADTMFTPQHKADAFVAMYHDQGLPVLKYAGFGNAVNISLGLPIIRTSVDHGTALELAGTGKAETGSLQAAVKTAWSMVKQRNQQSLRTK
ncbi:4-hydroxythreonine-4-phosphate dehydrogenase [Legionella birminghamensis]|uniref:4-hydroxythreonine-4-phosphate dehydrogenase n=1 Tax=Legionella birminghamensis TaxID=28083 RepID=A0A378IEX9_9GAMM|nr:4-hydroxythreonine-4-phosphate dehydrogenase PdxA [Legionella birminghamensis]KTC66821.1 4-hydroxythreonine-4-phosphate dehydrogenase [Legionella birminghamensis]STX33061.1 4-hydroxythreonine-4-phosphate dehydrogenase [Legionella birminghamensis]